MSHLAMPILRAWRWNDTADRTDWTRVIARSQAEPRPWLPAFAAIGAGRFMAASRYHGLRDGRSLSYRCPMSLSRRRFNAALALRSRMAERGRVSPRRSSFTITPDSSARAM